MHRHLRMLPVLALLAGPAAAQATNAVVIDFDQGRLILGWIGLWLVSLLTFVLCADKRIGAMTRLANYLAARSRRRAQARAEEALLALALGDPRIMADLRVIKARAEMFAMEAVPDAAAVATPAASTATRPAAVVASRPAAPRPGFRTAPLPGLPRHLQYLPG